MKRLMFVLSLMAIANFAAETASAGPIIDTPTGLVAGDHFRLAFVTTGTTKATSSDVATYDTFVTNQALGATYNGNTITWQALVSSSTVNVRTHVGETGAAVYLVDGTKVAGTDSIPGLWSGAFLHAIDEDINQVTKTGYVWTGTNYDGKTGSNPVGQSSVNYGNLASSDVWLDFGQYLNSASYHVYGISEELTVPSAAPVPEPSTFALLGLGGIGLVVRTLRRRRVTV